MTVQQWSTTAASNNSAPPTGAPEGQTPGSVNNVMREMMSSVAIESQVNRVKVLGTVAGTNTITAVMTPALTAYSAGMTCNFDPAVTNTAGVTININGLGALDIFRYGGEALQGGDLLAGTPAHIILDAGADDFYLLNPQNVGFRNIPPNGQSGDYTCVLADSGKHIIGTATHTLTIPANASVAYPLGTVLTFINASASTALTIAITTDTLTLSGTTTTGSRTLAGAGVATAIKVSSTAWFISGAGLS